MTSEEKIPLILQILIFFIPVNIYVIGEGMGAGIQWLFFRYNQTTIGNGFVLLIREIYFVYTGVLPGRSAFATIFYGVGVGFIVIASILIAMDFSREESFLLKYAAIINFAAAIAFIASVVAQYGVFLHGSSGIDIPLGIPVILIIAFWQYRIARPSPVRDDDNAVTV